MTVPEAASRVVTIDGPAGSGKSTLGRRLASALRLPFIDTGLFYRAVAAAAAASGLGGDDAARLAGLARSVVVDVGTDPREQPAVRVDGVGVAAAALHDPAHAALLAAVSRTPGVRAALLEPQRRLAVRGAVAVGRDCGTVVFPGAPLKIYLEAEEPVRAQRRAMQLRSRGAAVDVALLDAEVRARDTADTTRAAAPLRRPPGARVIDTGRVDVETMVARALAWCRELGIAS